MEDMEYVEVKVEFVIYCFQKIFLFCFLFHDLNKTTQKIGEGKGGKDKVNQNSEFPKKKNPLLIPAIFLQILTDGHQLDQSQVAVIP